VFFEELEIPRPNYNLGIGGGTHGQNTGRMIEKLEEIMMEEKPDWVLVYGDTDSTLAGAIAAAKLHIPVAHVEAGLRSFNRKMPEEVNRVLTDHVADMLFAPTEAGRQNLVNEGVAEEKIKLVGDVMYDAALFYKERARIPKLPEGLVIEEGNFVLCTIHRAENTDEPERLKNIFKGLGGSAETIVLPMHPRTKGKVSEIGIEIPENVWIIDPVGYLEMIWLESNCRCIATDSGGVQKEAYFHCKTCVTLRDETEWVELVDAGWNVLAGSDSTKIAQALNRSVSPETVSAFYGDGRSADAIVSIIGMARV
jgi:UDP-GlcNAc3NAcA epimerase